MNETKAPEIPSWVHEHNTRVANIPESEKEEKKYQRKARGQPHPAHGPQVHGP